MPVMRKIVVEHGSVVIDVHGNTLTARMINRDGAGQDLFAMTKQGKVTPARLPHPWRAPDYKKPERSPELAATPPVDHKLVIPGDAEWQYTYRLPVRGREWTQPGFNPAGWLTGRAGFGHGTGSFRTDVSGMRPNHTVLYARREFHLDQADRVTELGIKIDYRDGYVAYVNGREVARSGVARGSGRNAQEVRARDRKESRFVALPDALKFLVDGVNTFAIEAHRSSGTSREFLLHPALIVED
jgi:hypothetical protein